MTNLTLPPDPEELNDQRAAAADAAIRAFRKAMSTDLEDAVCDLLVDLHHWCDRNGFDFTRELNRAEGHYEAETEADNG